MLLTHLHVFSTNIQLPLMKYSPFLLCTIWTLSVTMDEGTCQFIKLYVKPGKVLNNLGCLHIVMRKFEPGGKHLMMFGAATAGTPVTLEIRDNTNGLITVTSVVKSRTDLQE